MAKKDTKQDTFVQEDGSALPLETAFEQLDQIVEKLESPEISLEESFREYQEGMKLLAYCKSTIDEVEKKVLEISASGELKESETLNEF